VTKKTILIFDQAESAGGSIARAVDLANQMKDFQFVVITYHPLGRLYNGETENNISAKHVLSFYNYQKKHRHIEWLRHKTRNRAINYIGLKLIAFMDLINECSVLIQCLVKTRHSTIDLVQANGGVHFLPYRVAKLKNAALIYYFRHLDDYRWAKGAKLNRASEFVFVGEGLKQRHLELLQLPEDKCSLVHSPFDAQNAIIKTPEHDLGFLHELKREGYFVILQAARICHEKGQHISIDALIRLKESHPKIALIIAGELEQDNAFQYHQLLRNKIHEHHLADRILFIGQRDDVLRLLSLADMALQTPLWFEALSGALVEAMQMGVLTISADIGGASEVITHSKTGLLFPAGDSETLAELIAQVVEKKIDVVQLALAGKKHAHEQWNPTAIQQQMQLIYLRAIDEYASRHNKRAQTNV
jgi:glycosyltransferase involved in cell wall biosynthesis